MKSLLTFSGVEVISRQPRPGTSRHQNFPRRNPQILNGVRVLPGPRTPFDNMKTLTIDYLKECIEYNPEVGTMVWKERPRKHFRTKVGWLRANTQCAGKSAGCMDAKGYSRIRISNNLHHAHRLAWLLIHGVWPVKHIDHVNGNKWDNRIANLREATVSQNMRNSRIRKDNLTGVKNVRQDKRKCGSWHTTLRIDGKNKHLGSFSTKEAAEECVRKARVLHYGEFANHG